MNSTLLYSVFHLNLAFSSIEREDYPLVVERCYYPILDLIEEGLPVAIEATAQTLIEIERIDKGFSKRLKRLVEEGKTEFIASGFSQVVMPLAPAVVNRWNLELGGNYYELLLGVRPKIALVNEQSFSAGIVDIYKESGFGAIIMDWSNSYQYNKYPKDYLFYPQSALGLDCDITVLWSHSISFQKFQRYAHGELTLEEYKEFLFEQLSADNDANNQRSFPLYVNDAEVFAYRPGTSTLALKDFSETEWGRISVL
ncbi:MAG: glycoside hydrolase, partial [Proteobacteria bacterium]|nr:glycoside hydrolase [Pseudomonadota bacterium]